MESPKAGGMIGLLCFVLATLASPLKSKLRLEAENAVLRHQLIVLKRRLRGRVLSLSQTLSCLAVDRESDDDRAQ